MRIWERDPRKRSLTTIYVPQEPRELMPTELADEIVLTHPAQPFPSSFHQIRLGDHTGAVNVLTLAGLEPEIDRYFWVHSVSGTLTDGTARLVTLSIQHIGTLRELIVAQDKQLSVGQSVFSPRSLLIPRGHRLFLRSDVLTAGAQIFLRYIYLDFVLAEIPPQL